MKQIRKYLAGALLAGTALATSSAYAVAVVDTPAKDFSNACAGGGCT